MGLGTGGIGDGCGVVDALAGVVVGAEPAVVVRGTDALFAFAAAVVAVSVGDEDAEALAEVGATGAHV